MLEFFAIAAGNDCGEVALCHVCVKFKAGKAGSERGRDGVGGVQGRRVRGLQPASTATVVLRTVLTTTRRRQRAMRMHASIGIYS